MRIKEKGEIAEIKDVINTIYCDISVSYAFQSNTIVVNSAIDNLLKGAASQAIQCLDIMSSWYGWKVCSKRTQHYWKCCFKG